jgi:RNA polymerase sigma factor (sigma-70 family)
LSAAVTHAAQLRRFLRDQVSDGNEVQDLLQEVYIRILKLRRPEEIRSPKSYLYKVAANIAHEHRRRRDARPPHVVYDELPAEVLFRAAADWDPNVPESSAELAEELRSLELRLKELPSKVCATVMLHHRDGYTCQEIGRRLSLVDHRVKKYLAKGLAHCRGEAVDPAAKLRPSRSASFHP